jgi:hypothetical protein
MSKNAHTLAMFSHPEQVEGAIRQLKAANISGFRMEDVTLKSPIEYPELSEMLGPRPVYVQWFTMAGALMGSTIGFTLIASAQANFLLQVRGGRPVVPIPPDMVITYELFILIGVLMTVLGCFIGWKLPGKRSPLFNANVSEDKIALLVKTEPAAIPAINEIFRSHQALEIQGD